MILTRERSDTGEGGHEVVEGATPNTGRGLAHSTAWRRSPSPAAQGRIAHV